MKRNFSTIPLAALFLAGCSAAGEDLKSTAATPAPAPAAPAVPAESAKPAPAGPLTDGSIDAPDTMRWTYASGEAAAVSVQAWRQLADYAVAVSRQRKLPQSVPMGLPGAADGIGTTSCQKADGTQKPLAAVFDVDETVILNQGLEYWNALGNKLNGAIMAEWARDGAPHVAPVPGAIEGIARLRAAGITVVYNTNRRNDSAAGTAAAIEAAGLGKSVHLDTLYLAGDDALGGNKDGRRAMIAERFCVIALGGDNLGDFANIFQDKALAPQQRRALIERGDIAKLWGAGWFALPNAAYGAWQNGSVDDVFPPASRWTPKTEGSDK